MESYRDFLESIVGRNVELVLGGPGGSGKQKGRLVELAKDFLALEVNNVGIVVFPIPHIIAIKVTDLTLTSLMAERERDRDRDR